MNIVKPKIDTNEYKHIILENKLKVLLIYDKNTDMSAAAMNVNVGYYNDPNDSQGIAHFLEHMLFMGTTKWPKENYYNEFINKSGGSTNAHTLEESTTYYFEVLNKYFFEAINIFSNFFVEPLLSVNAVEREINAINSEYLKNDTIDIVRILSVLKEVTADKTHPYRNFGFGNKKTLLKDNIRGVLEDFYNKYYSSNIMDLVVLSNNSIADIETKIIEIFSKIPNKNIEIPCKINNLPFHLSDDKPLSLKVVPIQDMDTLYIFFQIPNMDKYYKYKPVTYLLHLLGYKAKGSLHDILILGEYSTKVKCNVYESDTSFHLLGIYIELTKKGLENYEYIIDCVMEYINLIKDSEFHGFLLDEMKILNNIAFDYSVIDEKISYVSNLSMNMIKYKINDVIYGDYVIDIENISKIKELVNICLEHIDIKKSIIIISSKTFKHNNNLREKWFDVEYNYININYININTTLKGIHIGRDIKNNLKLPIRNDFIPYDLKLLQSKNDTLTKLDNNIWYKFDKFNVPKVFMDVIMYTDKINKSPTNYLLFDLYLTLFERYNYDKLYYARQCETGYAISNDINFMMITFYGFNNNIHKIIELFTNTFLMFIDHITQSVFEFAKNECITDLENYIYEPLYVLASERIKNSIYLKEYSNEELLSAIQDINFTDINEPKKWFYKNCNLKIFIYGNVSDSMVDLTKYFDIFDNKNNLIINNNKIVELYNGESQIYIIKSQNPSDNNYLIHLFYEIGCIVKQMSGDWISKLLCIYFIDIFVKEKFFTQVRTNEQSGYIVKSFIKKFLSDKGYIYGLSFLIQSPHINPPLLRKRIKKFIGDMYKLLLKLKDSKNEEKFELYKNNIKLMLGQKLVSQYEEHDFIFNEILSNEYVFDYKKILIENIDLLNIDMLIKFYETHFINKNTIKVRVCEIYKNLNKKN